MARLKPLDPAPTVSCLPLELLATDAGRDTNGLCATVLVRSAEQPIDAQTLHLAQRGERQAYAALLATLVDVQATDVESALLELIEAVEGVLRRSHRRADPATERTGDPDARPVIQVNGRQLREVVDEAVAALRQANLREPTLFERGGTLVRIKFARKEPDDV